MNVSKIMDYLKYADSCYCSMKPLDVPDVAAHAYMLLAQIKNSDKCVRGRSRGTAVAGDCMKMMSILLGSEEELKKKPMLVCNPNPSSPLTWDKPMIEGSMVFAEHRQIPIPSPEILSGAIGPVTLAGTIALNNAEILSMLTFIQLFNPGTPVMYGTVSAALDMKTAMMRIGGPELGIMHVGLSQLARRYKLPMRGTPGNSDSNTLDVQAGYEAGFNIVLAVLSGVDLVTYAFGSMEFTATLCYEKIITDHEFLGMVERLVRGIEVSDETLGVDLIDEVGPGGHFLAKKHTRRHHSREHFVPNIFDTRPYETWAASDTKDIRVRAREEVKRILREHEPPPLDRGVEKELEEYVRMVEKRRR
jgi:trimethylamine--corrinoid protein Co-methyltransferase